MPGGPIETETITENPYNSRDEYVFSSQSDNTTNDYSADERFLVDPSIEPYAAVFPIHTYPVYRDDNFYYGTAFFIDPGVALTAAHNVVDRPGAPYIRSLNIEAIRDEILGFRDMGQGTLIALKKVIAFGFPKQYISNSSFGAYDYALLFFEDAQIEDVEDIQTENVVEKAIFDAENLLERLVSVTGYPLCIGEKQDGTLEGEKERVNKEGKYQYCHQGQIVFEQESIDDWKRYALLENHNVLYRVHTSAGQSGAPVINADTRAVGIHTGGFYNRPYKFNRGIKFTENFFQNFDELYRHVSLYGEVKIKGNLVAKNNRATCWDVDGFYIVVFNRSKEIKGSPVDE